MKRLNILELHRTINEKNERKNECYEKVLEICHKRIVMATEHRKMKYVFVVPEYIPGYPIYDLNLCIKHIIKSLETNGFLVTYVFPKYLYISWDFDEIKKDIPMHSSDVAAQADKLLIPVNKSRPIKHEALTSSLLMKHPKAPLNMKSSGKLELTLY